MNLIQTTTTYATYANAEKALATKLARAGQTLQSVRYLIAVKEDGRFAPVLVGIDYLQFALCANVTVVG